MDIETKNQLIWQKITSNMPLKRSARLGSFNAVTNLIDPFIDFSIERSLASSVALTSLSPSRRTLSKKHN